MSPLSGQRFTNERAVANVGVSATGKRHNSNHAKSRVQLEEGGEKQAQNMDEETQARVIDPAPVFQQKS